MYTPFQKTHYENQKLWTLSLPLPFSGRRNVTIPINSLLIGIVLFDQAIKEGQQIYGSAIKIIKVYFSAATFVSFLFLLPELALLMRCVVCFYPQGKAFALL